MRAVWIVPPEIKRIASGEEPEQALLGCWLASIRTRAAVAALEWRRSGNENLFWDPAAAAHQGLDWNAVNICVVPKYFSSAPREPWYRVCTHARASGCPLLIDLCDYPSAMPAQAEMKSQWVEYSHGDTKLKAYMAYDDKITGRRPAVLVAHARSGMSPQTLKLTEIWAKLCD
jgi:hypothetical protein